MGRSIAVTVGEIEFRKKDDLVAFMHNLIDRYAIGAFLSDEDMKFCLQLFAAHTEFPQKLAPGVARIQLLRQDYGTKGFQIHKMDGTSDNISWKSCVTNLK